MIRMTGLVDLKAIHSVPVGARTVNEEELTDKQKQLDVDKDGKIEGEDLAKLRKQKSVNEDAMDGEEPVDDHEGRMAKADLMSIHNHAKEIYNMLGDNEELEGWVQAKITKAEHYMNAVYNNMKYEKNKPAALGDGEGVPADATTMGGPADDELNEVAPEGWEGTVKAMKKYKDIDNPWALAYYMKSKGYKPHKKEPSVNEDEYDSDRDAWLEKGGWGKYPRRPAPKSQKMYRPPTQRTVTQPTAQSATTKDALMNQKVKYRDEAGKEHEATVKSLLGYDKNHPGRKIAARMYAQYMAKNRK